MKDAKQSKPVTLHPMFRAMVVMGNGLAVGCGGIASNGRTGVDDGAKDAGASGASSSSTDGGGGGGGASFVVSTGGTNAIAGSGGEPMIAAGGTTTIGTGGAPNEPPGCPPAQYDCSGVTLTCVTGSSGWTLGACGCDFTRPLTAKDCAGGETFLCRNGAFAADGQFLNASVPFECSCVATPSSCNAACDDAFRGTGGAGIFFCNSPTDHSILCGCAVIGLR